MRWFRFYTEAVHDPKVQLLPPALFKDWVNILCLTGQHGGAIPDYEDKVAFALRVTKPRAKKTIQALIEAELLEVDGDKIVPHNWSSRQYSANDSTERVRKYRENLKKNGETVGAHSKFRSEVFQRDGHACIYCGSTERLCLDHIVPVQYGGRSEVNNLATACKSCNSGKSGRTPEQAGMSSVTEHGRDIIATALKSVTVSVTVTDRSVTNSVTAPDTEQIQKQNRTEQKQSATALGFGGRNIAILDPQWQTFYDECVSRHVLPGGDMDWKWAQNSWLILNVEEKEKAIGDVRLRPPDSPEMASLPQNYIKERKWTRPMQRSRNGSHGSIGDERLRNA